MARISKDGKHLEMTSDPKWREEQQAKEEKRKDTEAVKFAVETYHHSGAGPTTAELNKEAAKNSKITQRLGESEKNLTYTGKYLEAKGEMVSSTEQSFLDYQAELGLNEDYKRLDEMEAEFAKNPSRQLAQEHDELLDAVIKKEQMLKVYEQAYLDTVESYNSLVQQGQDEWKTYQEVWENWDKNRRVFHYMMDDYQENDWDQLSDEAKTALQGHEGYQNETSQATIDWIGEKLISIDDEIEVTQKKHDEKLMYYRDYYHEHGEYPEGYQAAEAELDGYQEKIQDLEADKKQYKQMQKNESNELDFRKQYGGLKYNSDFHQYAGYAPIGYGLTPNPSTIDTTYVRINSAAKQENDAGEGYLGEMTPSEVQTFNYIYRKNGKDAAEEYMRELTPVLYRRDRESTEEAISEFAGENGFTGTLASIGSVLTKPLEGISYLGQGIDYLMDGEIDENAPYNVFVYGNNAARSAVNENIKKHWGEAGSFMYQLGMGLADFTYTMVLSHGLAAGAGAVGAPIGSVAKAASNLSLAIMSTEAAAETVLDAKDRGLEDGDAFWLGTIAGATELLTEKVSIDTLLNGIGKGKSKLGYLLKNALAEGGEEMTSSAVNWLADVMISKDKSEWEEILFYYRAMGFSEDVAFMEALKEQGRQMLKEGAAGAITGAAAAGGRLALGQISEGIQNHKNYREAVQNGRQYYALNQLSQGDLARSLGNMNVEQAYRTMSPEAILETFGLNPRQAQYLLENTGYSPEGRANRPSVNQVYNALQSAGLSSQEIQNVVENSDRSFQKPFGSLPVSAAGGNSNYPADSGILAGTKQNRKGNLDLSKSTGYSQEEASLRVAAEKAYAALQSAGLSPQAIQNIMENNGNSLQKLFESAGVDYDSISNILKGTERKQMGPQTLPEKNRDFLKGGRTQPAAEKAYAALQSAGLSPREIQNLLGNNGHSFQKILDFPALTSENNSLSHSAVSRMLEKADFQQNDPQNQQKRNGYSLGQERDLKLSLAPLEKGMEESLANLEKEGILGNEESTIQSRNSARGKAAAVLHFDVDLNSRQKSLLEKLPEFNSRTTVPKESVNMTDLSALTAKTGVEFAMFTKGNQRLIVRGNTIKTPIYLEEAKQLAQEGYRWSGHTHPGTTSNALMYSSGDVDILKCFPQEKSIIYNSIGLFADFRKDDL